MTSLQLPILVEQYKPMKQKTVAHTGLDAIADEQFARATTWIDDLKTGMIDYLKFPRRVTDVHFRSLWTTIRLKRFTVTVFCTIGHEVPAKAACAITQPSRKMRWRHSPS